MRIEHQVHHGVGGRAVVVQKRVVKNVVEDAAIHLGLAAIVCQEAVRGDGPVFARSRRHVAHPDRQRPQLFQAPGHLVSLAVEKNLEPVLDPPKKAIGVIHDASFIGGEATDLFELVNGQQGIGAADLGILAAVQQLEKLDHELDVANSTVARLDLEIGPAGRDRALFDPPLQRLDLRDLAGTQVAAVDERGDRPRQTCVPGRDRRRPDGT